MMISHSLRFSGQGGIRTHTPFRTDASKTPLSRQFQHLAKIVSPLGFEPRFCLLACNASAIDLLGESKILNGRKVPSPQLFLGSLGGQE